MLDNISFLMLGALCKPCLLDCFNVNSVYPHIQILDILYHVTKYIASEPSRSEHCLVVTHVMAFSSNGQPRLGTLDLEPLLHLPALPNIIMEWAAIIPLVCHLVSFRRDWQATGEISLLGRINLGLFPKLGTLSGLSRLLFCGQGFLDQASIRGGTTSMVWDVRWGSVFPCANGAANGIVSECLQSRELRPPTQMPETVAETKLPAAAQATVPPNSPNATNMRPSIAAGRSIGAVKPLDLKSNQFRRYQTLRVLRFRLTSKQKPQGYCCSTGIMLRCRRIVPLIFLFLWAVMSALCGAYGTAGLLLCSTISHAIADQVSIQRPSGYLQSNEVCDGSCMLVASHQNSQEWTLFIGDRGVIDSLLNKPMISVSQCRINRVIAVWFRIAHLLQLLIMTFVAAQKGWDGVLLLALMAADIPTRWRFRNRGLAKSWISDARVTADVYTFHFSSRMVMLGAIELFRGHQPYYLDGLHRTTSPPPRCLAPKPFGKPDR